MNRKPAEVFPPSEFICDEMASRKWNAFTLAWKAGLTTTHVLDLMSGEWISDHAAAGLAKAFGTSADFWLNLQRAYDEGRR